MRVTLKQSFLMALAVALGAGRAAHAAAPYASEVPTTYAKFDKDAGAVSLVVAELVATSNLEGYDCPKMEPKVNANGSTSFVVCLNPPPFWFKARVLQQVGGADIGDEFYAVTGSHYGPMKVGPTEPARLMLLRSNGKALEMLRYAAWPVARAADGQYHIVVEYTPVPRLPCWTAGLMQEIADGEFTTAPAITREQYDSRFAEKFATLYHVTAEEARPRYTIPVARLEQALKGVPLAAADFSCASPK